LLFLLLILLVFKKSIPIPCTFWFNHIYTYFSLSWDYGTQLKDADSGSNTDILPMRNFGDACSATLEFQKCFFGYSMQ